MLRNAENMNYFQIEQGLNELGEKVCDKADRTAPHNYNIIIYNKNYGGPSDKIVYDEWQK